MKIQKNKGFTLIELMIAVSILSIIMMVGVPSFSSSINKNSVAATVNDIQTSLNQARSEAVTRGVTVTVCSSNNQVSCSGGWDDGWIVFSDIDADNVVDGGADLILSVFDAPASDSDLRLSALDSSMIQYFNNGYSNQTGTFIGCPPDKNIAYSRGVIVSASGMIRKSRDGDGDGTHEDSTGTDFSCP